VAVSALAAALPRGSTNDPTPEPIARPRVAEFFAGIGLVRVAMEAAGFEVVFANDVEPFKAALYAGHLDSGDFWLGDVRDIRAERIPDIDIATASFPCTDLSLAGNRAGLAGDQSSLFWAFHRILDEMGGRRPRVVLLENVPSFATSHGGEDLRAAIAALNGLGYSCDLLVVDARWFVPQSRPRLFIVGTMDPPGMPGQIQGDDSLRPAWLTRLLAGFPDLRLHAMPISLPVADTRTLADVVEQLPADSPRWWDAGRTAAFVDSLAPVHRARLEDLRLSVFPAWATAYRRTRRGVATWEIRSDAISGCLRTARGGSSKQAMVEARGGATRVRWMMPSEYARLQGADQFPVDSFPENRVLFGFGDAVCVPVVEWLAREYLRPLVGLRPGDD
jgi:DNA (cytosine-5)-methyltransferase 1